MQGKGLKKKEAPLEVQSNTLSAHRGGSQSRAHFSIFPG